MIIMGVIIVATLIGLVLFAVFASYFRWWIQSYLTGAGIRLWDLLGMTFRNVRIGVIVKSKIMAIQAGLGDDRELTTQALEAHYLAGGNVRTVIQALVAANKAKTINALGNRRRKDLATNMAPQLLHPVDGRL